jgi:Spy/CpxP family protein refolding chaperone
MKFSKTLTVALVLTIIFVGVVAAEAMGPAGHHHGAGLFGLKTLLQLNLTDQQKSQILSIFANYDMKTLKKNLWQARKALRTAISQAKSTDDISSAITTNLPAVQAAQKDLLSARTTMAFQIKAVLGPEQLPLLKQHKRATQGAPPTTPNQ